MGIVRYYKFNNFNKKLKQKTVDRREISCNDIELKLSAQKNFFSESTREEQFS